MAKKEQLLNLLAEAVKQEISFVDQLTAEEREAVGASDNWSAKDVIAHCAFWKERRTVEIPKVLQGESAETFGDFDHENDRIFNQFCDSSWEDVTAFSRKASHSLIGQVQKMSEEELERPYQENRPIWRMVAGNGYSHTIAHLADQYQKKGNKANAIELTALLDTPLAELDESPNWQGTVKYNVACSLSLLGEKDAAIAELREALTLTPSLIDWSKQDTDLDPLRDEAAFQALYEE